MDDMILVVAEQREGKLNRSTLEAVVAAQRVAPELSKKVSLLLLGKDVGRLADEVAASGVQEVIVAEDDKLADYTPDGYTTAIKQVMEKEPVSPRTCYGASPVRWNPLFHLRSQ